MKEIWRNIVGYEGLYQVSNFGRVKSLERVDRRGNRVLERILKPGKTKNGYLLVNLWKDNKAKTCYVHRLVGMTFPDMVGWTEGTKGRPFEELQINHKSEFEKANNHVSNLEWITQEDNLKYGTHNERVAKTLTGVYNTKLSKRVAQKTKDGELVKIWPSTKEVERQLGWGNSHISKCCNGKQKSYKGFLWEFVN